MRAVSLRGSDQDLDPWTLGLLSSGPRGAVQAALASLWVRGAVQFVADSLFRVGPAEGASSFEAQVFAAVPSMESTLWAVTRLARNDAHALRVAALSRGLVRRFPWWRATRSGKAALFWHRAWAEPIRSQGRQSGLRSMTARTAAFACALLADVPDELHWAAPRWASRAHGSQSESALVGRFDAPPDLGRYRGSWGGGS